MFGPLGLPEVIFLLLLALLIFGPRKLPELGRTLGKGLSEFRKASTELKRTFNSEIEDIKEADPRRILRDDPPRPSRRLPDPKPKEAEPERHEPPPDTASAGEKESGEKEAGDGRVARGSDLAAEEKTPAPVSEVSRKPGDSEEREEP